MHTPPTLLSRPQAFTLIELLTVIAIIGILAAILIPTASSVRQRARSAQCSSNLRQIGVGMSLYASENKQRFPKAFDSGDPVATTWIQKASPYVATEGRIGTSADGKDRAAGVFLCPDFTYDPATRRVPYGLNIIIDPISNRTHWNYRQQIPSPSRTFLVLEIDANDEFARVSTGATNRHAGPSANYLFADGHVENIRSSLVDSEDPRWWKTP